MKTNKSDASSVFSGGGHEAPKGLHLDEVPAADGPENSEPGCIPCDEHGVPLSLKAAAEAASVAEEKRTGGAASVAEASSEQKSVLSDERATPVDISLYGGAAAVAAAATTAKPSEVGAGAGAGTVTSGLADQLLYGGAAATAATAKASPSKEPLRPGAPARAAATASLEKTAPSHPADEHKSAAAVAKPSAGRTPTAAPSLVGAGSATTQTASRPASTLQTRERNKGRRRGPSGVLWWGFAVVLVVVSRYLSIGLDRGVDVLLGGGPIRRRNTQAEKSSYTSVWKKPTRTDTAFF